MKRLCVAILMMLYLTETAPAQINILNPPFRAKCDSVTDDTAAIQAANDFAYTSGQQEVIFPATGHCCKFRAPLYMDAPGNLRSGTITKRGFSLKWRGTGLSADVNRASALCPMNDDAPAIWIGPGSGMTISGLYLRGPASPPTNAAFNTKGVGIAISRDSTQTLIENTFITNFYAGVKTGANGDGLSDSVTLRKVWMPRVYRGFWVGNSQNFILDLDETHIVANQAIYNPQNLHINVRGGSFGGPEAQLAVFNISNTSALADTGDGSYTFTTTITNPNAILGLGAYSRSALKTAHFGVIPLLLTNYATGVATFRVLDSWRIAHFADQDLLTATDLQAEIKAALQVFCAEERTIFTGAVYAQGVHIETPPPHVLLDMVQAKGNQQHAILDRIRYNGDPSAGDLAGNLGAGNLREGAYLIQQSHPWLDLSNYPVVVRDGNFNVGYNHDSPMVDGKPSNARSATYFFERNVNLWSPNLRYWGQLTNDDVRFRGLLLNRYKGFGFFDSSPFEGINAFSWGMDGQSPTIGYRPAPWATPRLRADQFTVVSGKLPAIGTYPLIHGDTLYQVISDEVTQPTKLVRSSHRLLSYGQNIPGISWTYKGGSPVIQVSDTSLLMAGQYIGLNLPDYGMAWFVVTGVFKGLGYVTTTQIGDGISVRINPGDRFTVYRGTGILQEPYKFTSVTLQ